MAERWVNTLTGTPLPADFNTTNGAGTPITIDAASALPYALLNNVVTPLSARFSVPDRATLAAITGQVAGAVLYLNEILRQGWFTWDSSNLSTKVTGDPQQGIYIAPTSDPTGASGAWVRRYVELVFDWFGAIPGDYTTGIGTACDTAWAGMHSYLDTVNRNVSIASISNGPVVNFPGAQYYFANQIVLNRALYLKGAGGRGEATWLRFPASTGGLVCNYPGSTCPGEVSTTGAGGSVIEGFLFEGGAGAIPVGASTASQLIYSLLRIKQGVTVRNCYFRNARGVGICASASSAVATSDPFYGNINGLVIENCYVQLCAAGGSYISGGDANVIKIDSLSVDLCGRFGNWWSPFLGAAAINCQVAGCGFATVFPGEFCMCAYAGAHYYAKYDATTAALQGETPGTGANWIWLELGAADTNHPTWVGGNTTNWVPGGSYGGTGDFMTLEECYEEGGQAPAQLPGALSKGGFIGQGVGNIAQLSVLTTPSGVPSITSPRAFAQKHTYINASYVWTYLGGNLIEANANADLVGFISSAATGAFNPNAAFRITGDRASGDLHFDMYGIRDAIKITGFNTAETFGGRPQAEARYITKVDQLAIGYGNGSNTAIPQVFGSAVPTTGFHTLGEIVWNDGSVTALATVDHWRCSVAGTPGTWIVK